MVVSGQTAEGFYVRTFHRWFGLIAGFFFMLMSLTGIGMETIKLVVPEQPRPASVVTIDRPHPAGPSTKAPDGPPRKMDFYHWLNHIHDGELAGPTGRIVVLLLGFALFFFSVSGLWMYWKMYDGRSRLGKKQVFW
jgi:uncharacterized iron-regulated membrane protein